AGARHAVGLPGLRGTVAGAAPVGPELVHGRGQRAGDGDDRAQALQGPLRPDPAVVAERPVRPAARRLRRVGRALLAARLARLHRALEPPVADGVQDPEPGNSRLMPTRGYTVLGW